MRLTPLVRRVLALSSLALCLTLAVLFKSGIVPVADTKPTGTLGISTVTKSVAEVGGDGDGKADPGETLEYTVTITGNGTQTTNVQLNDVLSSLTTLSGSANIQPIAKTESFTAVGNTLMVVPDGAGDLLSNDMDLDGGTLEVDGFGDNASAANAPGESYVTIANGGSLCVRANGSFDYDPPKGINTAGTFFYRVKDGQGGTAVAQVNLATNGMIWYVNPAAAVEGDGRFSSPFKNLPTFNTANTGPGSTDALPQNSDAIFLYSGAHTGPLNLRGGQRLIGQGATATVVAITGYTAPSGTSQIPATGGTAPTITSSGNGVTLGNAVVVRGVTIGNVTGAKILGSNFGTSTIGNNAAPDVTLNGTGTALNLSAGTLFGTSGFASVASASSTQQGILISGVSGSVALGSTTISGSASQGIYVTNSTADINFGNTTIGTASAGTGGTNAVLLEGNSSGTRTFGTLTIQNTVGPSNHAFRMVNIAAVGGGNVVAGATNISGVAGTGNGIDIRGLASGTSVSFGNTSVSKTASAGTLVNLGGSVAGEPNAGTVAFASLGGTASNGSGLTSVNNTGAITVTTASGSISATNGPAVSVTGATAVSRTPIDLDFANLSSTNSTTTGINLVNVAPSNGGGLTSTGGTVSGSAGNALNVNTSSTPVSLASAFSKTTAGSLVAINASSANVTLSGNLTCNTSCGGVATPGINVTNNTGGTITFSGGTKTISTGANPAVTLATNTGTTINFTNGGLALTTTAGVGFNATGGGTISVQGNSNTVSTTTGSAVNVQNTLIGLSGLTFQSVTSTTASGNNAINLTSTGTTAGVNGGLTITGTDGVDVGTIADTGTGGTISNKSVDSILLSSTRGVSLNGLTVTNNTGGSWIDATGVVGLTLNNFNGNNSFDHGFKGSSVTGLVINTGKYEGGGTLNGVANFDGIQIINLLGTSTITGATFERANTRQIYIVNNQATAFNGTADQLTVSGNIFQSHNVSPFHGDHLSVSADTGGNFKLIVDNSSGSGNIFRTAGIGVQATGAGSGKMEANISNITSGGILASGFTNTAGIAVAGTSTSTVRFNVSNNTILGSGSVGMTFNDFTTNNFSGTLQNNNITHIAGAGTDALQIISHDPDNTPCPCTPAGNANIAVLNNTITGNFQRGIRAQAAFGDATLNLNIAGNTVNGTDPTPPASGGLALRAIEVEVGGSGGTTTDNIFLNLENNNAWMNNGNAGYRLLHRAGYTFSLEDFTGVGTNAADVTNWIDNVKANNSNGGPATTLITGAANNFTSHTTTPAPAFAGTVRSQVLQPSTASLAHHGNQMDTWYAAAVDHDAPLYRPNTMEPQYVDVSGEMQASLETPNLAEALSKEPAAANLRVLPPRTEETTLAENSGRPIGEDVLTYFAAVGEAISPTAEAAPAFAGETVTTGPFTLPANETAVIKFRVVVGNGPYAAGVNAITNTANVAADGMSPMTSNMTSIPLDAAPDLSLTVSDSSLTTEPGKTIQFISTYANGNSQNGQAATGVVVTQTVPADTTFNATVSGPGWSCANGSAAGTTCTYTVGNLAANSSAALNFAVDVLPALPAGVISITNSGSIADDGANGADLNSGDNSSNTETTPIIGNWLGTTSTDWHVATNWSHSTVPPAGNNISVPDVANQPAVLTQDAAVGVLTLNDDMSIAAGRTVTASGNVALGTKLVSGLGTLELSAASAITRTTGQVNATLKKNFTAAGAFVFPVGTGSPSNEYSPLNVNVSAGTGSLTVRANKGTVTVTPAMDPAKTLQRFWTLEGSGITADLTFNYLDGDVAGNEANYKLMKVAGGVRTSYANAAACPASGSPCVNTTANTMFISGVTSFSDWTASELEPQGPTAGQATVAGQVIGREGRGNGQAVVRLTDDAGNTRYARANTFGYFSFAGVEAGRSYVVSVMDKRHRYAASLVSVQEDVTGLVLTPER